MSAPSWDDLRCLEALARHGDVRRAARELGITASTLYRRVAALEASTGTRLLVRGVGPTALTEPASALARTAERVRGEIDGALADVRREQGALTGEVSLTTVEGMLPFLVRPLAAFAELHPGLGVQLHLGNAGPSVRRREVDVAVGVMERTPSECWGRRLFRFHFGVYGREQAARSEPLRWVVLGPEHGSTPDGVWETRHAQPVAVRASSRTAVIELVRAGVGVALLPRPLGALHPELVEIKRGHAPVDRLGRTAWVLTHESRRKLPRVAALTSVLAEHLTGIPGSG